MREGGVALNLENLEGYTACTPLFSRISPAEAPPLCLYNYARRKPAFLLL